MDKAVAQMMGVGSLPLPETVKRLARAMLFRKMDANASDGVDLDEWQRFLHPSRQAGQASRSWPDWTPYTVHVDWYLQLLSHEPACVGRSSVPPQLN